jgi:acetoin utilization deacetylase AcuC-like enzyme/acyl-CoA hydrolase/RimJ/RimL family protein N-acetyltransferase
MQPLHPDDWRKLVPPGGRVFIGSGAAVPQALVASFLEAARHFKDVEIVHIHTLGETPWVDARHDGVLRTNTFFLTPALRAAVEAGRADYTPCSLSEVPGFFSGGLLPVDLALVMTTPPDAEGRVSLGASVDVTRAALVSARAVVAQFNPRAPRSRGDSEWPLARIDRYLECAQELPELPPVEPTETQRRLGAYVAELVEDGATLQIGLGATARATLQALRGHRRLGIHTGMLEDGLVDLIRCGAADNSRKGFHAGRTVCSHVLGTRAAYDFVHENEEVEFHPSEWVNDPARIARNHRMVAINGARQIDLTGQVIRDSRGHHFHGGVGAQLDFIRGATIGGGLPVTVLTSTSRDGRHSRIVANLPQGSGIAPGRTDVQVVVTEFGIARLRGRSIRERVAALVQVAHPDFREDLLREARHWGWVPKFFSMPPSALRDGPGAHGVESRRLTLRGLPFHLRPLHPSDMRRLQEFFYSHDAETVRLRYGYARDSMPGESAFKLVAVDQNRDLALTIVEEHGGAERIRAIGRYYLDDDGRSAEVAFVVHEDYRRHGMAATLLRELARIAGQRGLERFWASVLAANQGMARLFLKHGARPRGADDPGAREFVLEIPAILAAAAAPATAAGGSSSGHPAATPAQAALGAVWDGVFEEHDSGPGHPESAVRYRAVWEVLERWREAGRVVPLALRAALEEDLRLCHEAHYLDIVRLDTEACADQLRTGDTPLGEHTLRVAKLAAGSCLAAVDAVLRGEVRRAFCAVRPPGHHASQARGMGFCLFNNVALAARHARLRHGVPRVLIVDWDVHHGNGTQDIFYDDPDVYFFSTHQWPLYPGTGLPEETGAGAARGTNLNITLPAGSGVEPALDAIDTRLVPAMADFKPGLVLVSAGFDARHDDPIGGLEWTDAGFAALTRRVIAIAEEHAGGRLVSVLEGGYNPPGLALAVAAHLEAMAQL